MKELDILVIDDDPGMLSLIEDILEPEGYRVTFATDGNAALQIISENEPALILLDLMLPDMDGCTICKLVRKFSRVPVIMVTSKVADDEKLEGFKAGADDYITKPFLPQELVFRVKAVLRRSLKSEDSVCPNIVQYGELKLDCDQRNLSVDGNNVELTETEYRLMCSIWGLEYRQDFHLLQVVISRLRKKFRDSSGSEYIKYKPRQGYMLAR